MSPKPELIFGAALLLAGSSPCRAMTVRLPSVKNAPGEDLNALFRRYERFKTTSFSPRRIYFSDAVIRNSKIEKVRLAAEKNPSSPEYRPVLALPTQPRPPIIAPFSYGR